MFFIKPYFTLLREYLAYFLKQIGIINKFNIRQRRKRGEIIPFSAMDDYLNVANQVELATKPDNMLVGLVKDNEYDTEGHFARRAYWPKYERFLKINNIPYSFYDILRSDWINEASKFDLILWHPQSSPDYQEIAKTKFFFLERYLGKKCYPSHDELWSYEDKVRTHYLYENFKLPCIPTFITNSKHEALGFIENAEYPLISKIATGSSSFGVSKIRSKRNAKKYINTCFSKIGRKTYWPFLRQINYIYFQEFISSSKYDLRIIVVGNKLFGYYRYPQKGDFRASGAGIIKKEALPVEAMKIALKTCQALSAHSLVIDLLFSEEEKVYMIVETSVFCGIDTAEQLKVDGKPGYYEYNGSDFIFKEGKYWIQELVLRELFDSLMNESEVRKQQVINN